MLNHSARLMGVLGAIAALTVPQIGLTIEPTQTQSLNSSQTQPIVQPLRLEIRLSKRQVTLYQGDVKVKTYPIAVGRPGWETPTGNFRVRQKVRNPIWVHPFTGEKVPGKDPENPLGGYWLGFWTDGKNSIGFHGTPTPLSIGKAASHGCVRMHVKDAAELFEKVNIGTVVKVVK
ncbi:MAG: L,D-transpeptidase [Phormidesmis sp. CAN_BIN44]|nr:L,D-transpeptidase [Phormidesmis sp. CAN_BIN44]